MLCSCDGDTDNNTSKSLRRYKMDKEDDRITSIDEGDWQCSFCGFIGKREEVENHICRIPTDEKK